MTANRDRGLRPFRLPLAIDSSRCLRCGACAGYVCPTGARRSAAQLLESTLSRGPGPQGPDPGRGGAPGQGAGHRINRDLRARPIRRPATPLPGPPLRGRGGRHRVVAPPAAFRDGPSLDRPELHAPPGARSSSGSTPRRPARTPRSSSRSGSPTSTSARSGSRTRWASCSRSRCPGRSWRRSSPRSCPRPCASSSASGACRSWASSRTCPIPPTA